MFQPPAAKLQLSEHLAFMFSSIARSRRIAAVLLVGMLGASILVGVLAGLDRLPAALMLAPPMVIVVVMAIRRLEFGVCLLPVVGAAVPLKVGSGTQSPVVAALMLAILLVGLGLLRALRASDLSAGAIVTLPSIALMVVWVAAYLWSNVELDPLIVAWPTFWLAQIGGTAILLISIGVLLFAMSVGRSAHWIQIATWAFIGCAAFALTALLTGVSKQMVGILETGGLFTTWAVALSLGQALFNNRLPWWLRVALGLHALLWEYKAAVLETWWFSGWVPPLVVIVTLILLRSVRLFACVAVVGGIVGALNLNALYATVWGLTVDKGDLTRVSIWQQSLDLFSRHPFLGTGPAGYATYFWNFYQGSAYSMSTHNNYMDVLAETGVLGAVIFGWFMLALIVAGWRARSYWRTGFNGAFAQGAFAGLVGLIVAMTQGDWFIPFVYNQTIAGFRFTVHSWVFLGFLVSLDIIRRSESHLFFRASNVQSVPGIRLPAPSPRLPNPHGVS